jgi:hypothetical protein
MALVREHFGSIETEGCDPDHHLDRSRGGNKLILDGQRFRTAGVTTSLPSAQTRRTLP